jgi:hypothetical protein
MNLSLCKLAVLQQFSTEFSAAVPMVSSHPLRLQHQSVVGKVLIPGVFTESNCMDQTGLPVTIYLEAVSLEGFY